MCLRLCECERLKSGRFVNKKKRWSFNNGTSGLLPIIWTFLLLLLLLLWTHLKHRPFSKELCAAGILSTFASILYPSNCTRWFWVRFLRAKSTIVAGCTIRRNIAHFTKWANKYWRSVHANWCIQQRRKATAHALKVTYTLFGSCNCHLKRSKYKIATKVKCFRISVIELGEQQQKKKKKAPSTHQHQSTYVMFNHRIFWRFSVYIRSSKWPAVKKNAFTS